MQPEEKRAQLTQKAAVDGNGRPCPNVVPAVGQFVPCSGVFACDGIVVLTDSRRVAAALPLPSADAARQCGGTVEFTLAPVGFDYVLNIRRETIKARAATEEGLYHAAVSIAQMIAAYKERGIPCGDIYDSPRFAARGVMLDVCRHFFDKSAVKRVIDAMALFKLNRLHFHLSDDQGFRYDSASLPLLAEKAAYRTQTCGDGVRHGGFYTRADLEEIVAYAADRFIEVVPEIDLPGHTRAILAAYPELSCSGKERGCATNFGIFADVLCVGKERVYDALDALIGELAEIFPCREFHIGGDEVSKSEWIRCPDCRRRAEREGLTDYEQLQGYFTERVIKILKKYGKTPVVWNEALYSGMLDGSAVVQYWALGRRAADAVTVASEKGRKIIVSRCRPYYADYPFSLSTLRETYGYEPAEGMAEGTVYGVEMPLWAEHISDEDTLFARLFPRAAAVAETAWSSRGVRDYGGFEKRFAAVSVTLDEKGVKYTPLKKCNPRKLARAFGSAAFGLKAFFRSNAGNARNWRSSVRRTKVK